MKRFIFLLVFVLWTYAPARACEVSVGYRVTQINGRVVALWYPTEAATADYAYSPKFSTTLAKDAPPAKACGAKAPLVVFSHGDLGCGLQSVVFTEMLARAGYVVAAPDHADAALCHTVPPEKRGLHPVQQPGIMKPQDWHEDSRKDRAEDVEAIIDALLADSEFSPVIDGKHIGLAGHSLGGYTVVGLAGGWASWEDKRIGAVLAMSPYVMPFQVSQTLGNVKTPLMYQGGTRDVGITPFLIGDKGAFAQANSPAYFLILKKAEHFAWVECGKEHATQDCYENVPNMKLLTDYGIAFFDRYLKGMDEPMLEQKNSDLAAYNYK